MWSPISSLKNRSLRTESNSGNNCMRSNGSGGIDGRPTLACNRANCG
jgi:hypothetical protein